MAGDITWPVLFFGGFVALHGYVWATFDHDTEWGPWGPWSSCSVTCGSGSMSRSRDCEHSPAAAYYTHCGIESEENSTCFPGDCSAMSDDAMTSGCVKGVNCSSYFLIDGEPGGPTNDELTAAFEEINATKSTRQTGTVPPTMTIPFAPDQEQCDEESCSEPPPSGSEPLPPVKRADAIVALHSETSGFHGNIQGERYEFINLTVDTKSKDEAVGILAAVGVVGTNHANDTHLDLLNSSSEPGTADSNLSENDYDDDKASDQPSSKDQENLASESTNDYPDYLALHDGDDVEDGDSEHEAQRTNATQGNSKHELQRTNTNHSDSEHQPKRANANHVNPKHQFRSTEPTPNDNEEDVDMAELRNAVTTWNDVSDDDIEIESETESETESGSGTESESTTVAYDIRVGDVEPSKDSQHMDDIMHQLKKLRGSGATVVSYPSLTVDVLAVTLSAFLVFVLSLVFVFKARRIFRKYKITTRKSPSRECIMTP